MLQPRHEVDEQAHIDHQPKDKRQRHHPVGTGDQHHHGDEVDADIDEDVEQLDHRLANGQRGLHHLSGDAAGKLVGEERQALAQQTPVHLPARNHRVIAE